MKITYEWMCSTFIPSSEYYDQLIKDFSELYSTQYGKWSQSSPINPGKNVKLSPAKIKDWLKNDNSSIYYAKDGDMLVGYAIAIQLNVPNYGVISWVTQLVVHEDYRNQEIAKSLLHSIWGFSDNFAWGIVSANPYAIRALEKTTRRRSDPMRIKHNLRKIISIGIENLPYINKDTEYFVNNEVSKINTAFYIDHSNVEKMISDVVTDTVPWSLGALEEGWEWLAFTFKDQLPFELSKDEINAMMKASDSVVQNAYKRMDFSINQSWTFNTENEAQFITKECELQKENTLIDFGCGQGRHSLALSKKGIYVTGIDYIDKNIEVANKQKDELNIKNVNFILGDCRTTSICSDADAAICLYDVIGTYADNEDNIQILENISNHLRPGGIALISVMNYELTLAQAKNKFVLNEDAQALLKLKPSNIMETTGNIFNPNYYLVDIETGVIYRREQFRHGRSLPVELIVRDKRFKQKEIESMCQKAGLQVEYSRFVNSRDWETGFSSTDKSAKEILVKCRKI